jgi:hypothetical protein
MAAAAAAAAAAPDQALLMLGIEHVAAVVASAPDTYVLSEPPPPHDDLREAVEQGEAEVRAYVRRICKACPAVNMVCVIYESVTIMSGQYIARDLRKAFAASPAPVAVHIRAGSLVNPGLFDKAHAEAQQRGVHAACAFASICVRTDLMQPPAAEVIGAAAATDPVASTTPGSSDAAQ